MGVNLAKPNKNYHLERSAINRSIGAKKDAGQCVSWDIHKSFQEELRVFFKPQKVTSQASLYCVVVLVVVAFVRFKLGKNCDHNIKK